MKLGLLTCMFGDRSLADTLALVAPKGINAVELGSGGVVGTAHCDPDVLLADPKALAAFKDTLNPTTSRSPHFLVTKTRFIRIRIWRRNSIAN